MTITAKNLHEMKAIQEHSGIRAVLIHLNGLTDHRFTALYRFDEDSLHNLFFFDRQQPEIVSCPEIPVLASYCVFVRSSGQTFVTPDSLATSGSSATPSGWRFARTAACRWWMMTATCSARSATSITVPSRSATTV
jgi:hypothetical protein